MSRWLCGQSPCCAIPACCTAPRPPCPGNIRPLPACLAIEARNAATRQFVKRVNEHTGVRGVETCTTTARCL
jgi:hypothetical protein